MQFTYYGHSCFSVVIGGKHILFDPFISHNPLASAIDINSIKADFILVSHGHADHIADCVAIANRTGALVVTNWEIFEWLGKQGVSNVHPMNTGGKKEFEFGWVKCVVANHSSGLPDGSYGGNPMGFVIRSAEGNFYYAGDTALTLDMQLIPRFANLHFSVLPIGDNFTMGYEDAISAAAMVQCRQVIGVHYDTFGFIKIDKDKAVGEFEKNGMHLLLPAIGETINIQ
jgi:L-ascorbate metabolism protein UlaG (beta-lactamase superfamily)